MNNYLHEEKEKFGTKDFLLGALIGGVVGAATALFLSPKSGPELRESVSNQTAVLKEKIPSKVTDLAQATKEKTSSLTHTISQQSSEAIAKLRGKKGEADELEELQSDSEFHQAGYDSIQQMLEETKKAFDETEKKLNH